MKILSYSDAPSGWAVCLQDDCPLREGCLRYAVGRLMPEGTLQHNMVLPAARQGDQCRLFATSEPVQIAYGMRQMLPRAANGNIRALRQELYDVFGSTPQFYRYRDGRYPITPEQQARIAELFQKHGIAEKPLYDRTSKEYFFPSV
ncbi:MAG: hypothetical protein IJS63_01955 [Bacteroidaceae bacterium]|nr:hypothetical protein [Bacteroidaceae bacterium]